MKFDNGQTRITRYQGRDNILLFEIFHHGEIGEMDIAKPFQAMRDNFPHPVHIAVVRHGNYSVSTNALQKLLSSSDDGALSTGFVGNVAYVVKNKLEKLMADFAKSSYFKGHKVDSFSTQEEAFSWLIQNEQNVAYSGTVNGDLENVV